MLNSKIKFAILIGVLVLAFLTVYLYKTPILNFFQKEITEQKEKIEPKTELQLQEQAGEIIKMKDFKRCDEIKDETYKTVCINNIALNLAQEKQDISYCQKIDDKLIPIKDCERQVIFTKSLEKEDINICKETQNQEIQKQCQDSFWPSLALAKNDVNLCNNALAEQEKSFCRDNYLFQKEFVQDAKVFVCEKFNDIQVGEDCKNFKENIGEPKTPELCANLKSNLFLNYCLMNNLTQRKLLK